MADSPKLNVSGIRPPALLARPPGAELESLLQREPPQISPVLTRALALHGAGDFGAAEVEYRRFLKTHPTHLQALNNAALVAKRLGRRDVAVLRLAKAVRHHPNAAEAHFNLANTLQELGRIEESVDLYRKVIALRPDYVKAHLNLGNALDTLHRFAEAAESYRQSLAYGGDNAETHFNLGMCLKQQSQSLDAIVHLVCAAELAPERTEFHYVLGVAYFELRNNVAAIAEFRHVLELDPEHEGARSALLFQAQRICNWSETSLLAPLVRAGTDSALADDLPCLEAAFENLTRDADPARNQAVAAAAAKPVVATTVPLRSPRPGSRTHSDKIRLGYISNDFREHPVAHVMGGVFGRHDRNRFTVTAYSYGVDDGSIWRRRIASECDRFVDLRTVPDDAAARQILEDGTDILIDLTLWTHGNRPRICAQRPASVQVQYLGFPGTSGAPYYDYAIVDSTVVPPDARPFWNERLVFMPDTYFIVDRDQEIAATGATRAAHGLPETGVVFCSFNQSYKIEPDVFGAWMHILDAVQGSVLWLAKDEDETEINLRREAQLRGIDPARLIFAPKVPEKSGHLERLGLADLALDTLNYNGHTTTADALSAGVPVISTMGRHFASRASASQLRAVNLPELIAPDIEEYIRLAVHLAENPMERARLKAQLVEARTSAPLFDTARSVANLEAAFERIWARFRAGAPFEDIHL